MMMGSSRLLMLLVTLGVASAALAQEYVEPAGMSVGVEAVRVGEAQDEVEIDFIELGLPEFADLEELSNVIEPDPDDEYLYPEEEEFGDDEEEEAEEDWIEEEIEKEIEEEEEEEEEKENGELDRAPGWRERAREEMRRKAADRRKHLQNIKKMFFRKEMSKWRKAWRKNRRWLVEGEDEKREPPRIQKPEIHHKRTEHDSRRPEHHGRRPEHRGWRPEHRGGRPEHNAWRPMHHRKRPEHHGRPEQDRQDERPEHPSRKRFSLASFKEKLRGAFGLSQPDENHKHHHGNHTHDHGNHTHHHGNHTHHHGNHTHDHGNKTHHHGKHTHHHGKHPHHHNRGPHHHGRRPHHRPRFQHPHANRWHHRQIHRFPKNRTEMWSEETMDRKVDMVCQKLSARPHARFIRKIQRKENKKPGFNPRRTNRLDFVDRMRSCCREESSKIDCFLKLRTERHDRFCDEELPWQPWRQGSSRPNRIARLKERCCPRQGDERSECFSGVWQEIAAYWRNVTDSETLEERMHGEDEMDETFEEYSEEDEYDSDEEDDFMDEEEEIMMEEESAEEDTAEEDSMEKDMIEEDLMEEDESKEIGRPPMSGRNRSKGAAVKRARKQGQRQTRKQQRKQGRKETRQDKKDECCKEGKKKGAGVKKNKWNVCKNEANSYRQRKKTNLGCRMAYKKCCIKASVVASKVNKNEPAEMEDMVTVD